MGRKPDAVFLVSHDGRFLDNVVTSTIAYEGTPENPGFWREYEGGVTDWITQSKRAAQITGSAKPTASIPKPSAKTGNEPKKDGGAPEASAKRSSATRSGASSTACRR